jgi:transposase
MQKRIHGREFKLEVVRQVASGEKRPAQICREYGLADSVLSRWRKEYQERGEAAFQVLPSGEGSTHEQKIAELERFCGQLALENQVLKKEQPIILPTFRSLKNAFSDINYCICYIFSCFFNRRINTTIEWHFVKTHFIGRAEHVVHA